MIQTTELDWTYDPETGEKVPMEVNIRIIITEWDLAVVE